MRMGKIVVFSIVILMVIIFLVPVASASITVSDQVKFWYNDGTYFTYPGTYDTISRINNVWYFDGTAKTVYPLPEIFDSTFTALGLFAITIIVVFATLGVAILFSIRSGGEVDLKLLLATISSVIAIAVILIVVALIFGNLQGILNIIFIKVGI
jgi:hypothetical protein